MISVPDPRDITLGRWAAELALQDPLVPHPPVKESAWVGWAVNVLAYSSLSRLLNPPDPRYYSDWRSWGTRLKQQTDAA